MIRSGKIIDFWFAENTKPNWFAKSPEFDEKIKTHFEDLYGEAARGELNDWISHPQACLALVILLDQFPRNMFRDNARAFATDSKALEISQHAIDNEFDQQLSDEGKSFLYMPFMHSENREMQAKSLELFKTLPANYNSAVAHKDIIDRFGRFPHRNEILGRFSTPAEVNFMKENTGF
jgi:uncharacterized protein (DUF924 family)